MSRTGGWHSRGLKLRRGETVFSSTGELVVTHQVLDGEALLCFSVPSDYAELAGIDHEARLDREHVKRLRDSLDAWLEMTEKAKAK